MSSGFSQLSQPLGSAKAYKEMILGRASGYGKANAPPKLKFFFDKFFIMVFHLEVISLREE